MWGVAFTASDSKFPCKPLLGPSPELMQPQPSLRIVQGSILWRRHTRGACWRWRWEVWGWKAFLRPLLHWQCQLGTVPYTIPFNRLDGKIRSPKFENTPSLTKRRSVPNSSYRTVWPSEHKPEHYASCQVMSFSDHISHLRVLVSREDMQSTV